MLQLPFELLVGGSYRCTPRWGSRAARLDDYHRLYLPRTGRAWIQRGEACLNLRPGRIYLIPGYQPITNGCEHRLNLEWLHFRAADLETELKLARLAEPVTWSARTWTNWRPVYRRMDELFAKPGASPLAAQVQAMLLDRLADLLSRPGAAARTLEQLRPALAYMDEHFRDDPPLAEVAAQVHLSPTHFHRRCRETLGMSPRRYMLRRRMELAQRLLRRGQMNVTEVAEACGYETVYHFSRAFKGFHGYPPRAVLHGDIPAAP
ncbi:MAG: helix-turn-helix domain-containing protein [Phycisphaeraceae bacterium]